MPGINWLVLVQLNDTKRRIAFYIIRVKKYAFLTRKVLGCNDFEHFDQGCMQGEEEVIDREETRYCRDNLFILMPAASTGVRPLHSNSTPGLKLALFAGYFIFFGALYSKYWKTVESENYTVSCSSGGKHYMEGRGIAYVRDRAYPGIGRILHPSCAVQCRDLNFMMN